MKVLILVTTYQSLVTILAAKIAALKLVGTIELHVASSFEDEAETRTPAAPWHRIEIARTIKLVHDMRSVWQLLRLIRREKYDVVHTHTAKAGFVGALAGWLSGVPVIHTYHGLPFYQGQRRAAYSVYLFLETLACMMRKAVFSQNRADLELLKKSKSIRCRVMFEGNGVDAEAVVAHGQRDKALVEHLWRPNVLRMVCVARLEPIKHLDNLIDAVGMAKGRGLVVQCIIAGKGPLEGSLNATIVQRGLQDTISIVYTPAIHALIAQADVAVLTSAKEGIPRGLMEAMALSKPVVATNVLGTQELVVHRQTGLLVPFGDADALCAALVELIDAPSLRDRLGEAGRKRIETQFNDEHIVATWTGAYKTLLMPHGCARESLVG